MAQTAPTVAPTPCKREPLSEARLRALLAYDPATGAFHWRVGRRVRAGALAGMVRKKKRPYRDIKVDGVNYCASRLAWLYMTGEWPPDFVDHENGDSLDDRWGNLRAATRSQNGRNSRVRQSNKLGVKGVRKVENGRYAASIGVEEKRVWLGTFDTIEEARSAYAAAAKVVFTGLVESE